MKRGDRVQVIAGDPEFLGLAGEIVDLTKNGDLVVALEVRAVIWKATFKPHDLELARK